MDSNAIKKYLYMTTNIENIVQKNLIEKKCFYFNPLHQIRLREVSKDWLVVKFEAGGMFENS